jgi:enoyl-CoA hydratase/carnithine racemase
MIVTGSEKSRAFSAGADLKEWLELYIPRKSSNPPISTSLFLLRRLYPLLTVRNKKGLMVAGRDMPEGFCGISRRKGLKPIIAAVNGYAFGILNLLCSTDVSRWRVRTSSQLVGRYILRC